ISARRAREIASGGREGMVRPGRAWPNWRQAALQDTPRPGTSVDRTIGAAAVIRFRRGAVAASTLSRLTHTRRSAVQKLCLSATVLRKAGEHERAPSDRRPARGYGS